MALFFPCSFSSPSFTSFSSISSQYFARPQLFRLCNKTIAVHSKSHIGGNIRAPFRGSAIVQASSESNGTEASSSEPPTDIKKDSVSVENSQLGSTTLQLNLEQKVRMKLAKKIRLRRKRLVRKRHLRKKGRWPPSKMKKNKNV